MCDAILTYISSERRDAPWDVKYSHLRMVVAENFRNVPHGQGFRKGQPYGASLGTGTGRNTAVVRGAAKFHSSSR